MRFLHLARHGEAAADGTLSRDGRAQARSLGERLAAVPLVSVHHSPLPRARETAELIGAALPGVPVRPAEELTDQVPPAPGDLPPPYRRFLDGCPADEVAAGRRLAPAAIARFARPAATDTHELIVTHAFVVGWFVRHALDAPAARWLGINAANAALTTILYRADRPPALVAFNDMAHLPPALRWTGFPPELCGV